MDLSAALVPARRCGRCRQEHACDRTVSECSGAPGLGLSTLILCYPRSAVSSVTELCSAAFTCVGSRRHPDHGSSVWIKPFSGGLRNRHRYWSLIAHNKLVFTWRRIGFS